MRHNLKISVSRTTQTAGIVTSRNIDIREHILRMLLGRKTRLTILIPGDTVDEVSISDVMEEGDCRS